ncbi:hypothetical protein [Microbacterium sp.]|uniref:hypothetical protein n=1 Tax=Microbacterium sp. TaxID=51671 RepID=UPI0027375607|nr:hypothetical protein [Microbacterium sp.]MDP3952780.1 hypothetical protein [Microbacterium sp.]
MNSRNRSILTFVIVLCSAALAVVGGLRLLVPASIDWIDALWPGIAARVLPDPVDAALGIAVGLAGMAVGVFGHAAARAGRAPVLLRIATVVVALALILLTPGGLIPFAGYSFAVVVILGVVVMTVLLVRRHPWWGVVAIAAVAAVATWVVVGLNAAEVARMFGPAFVEQLPGVLYAAAYLVAAVGLIARLVQGRSVPRGSFARWVLRHRTAITVVAACCALPYSIARASWLTPWPLGAPSGIDFSAEPGTLFTGLSLGAAMLSGGVLTLGLVRPWGRRFPRWMAGLGGHPVPIALAVVPASIVAALFTVGGVEMAMSTLEGTLSDGSIGQFLEFLFVFPFWLWGPLLALATWGYAMSRRADAAPDVQSEARPLTRTAPRR